MTRRFIFSDLACCEHRLDPGYLVTDPNDAVAVGVQLGDPCGVELGGEPEPLDLAALEPGLLDGPDVGDRPSATHSRSRSKSGRWSPFAAEMPASAKTSIGRSGQALAA